MHAHMLRYSRHDEKRKIQELGLLELNGMYTNEAK